MMSQQPKFRSAATSRQFPGRPRVAGASLLLLAGLLSASCTEPQTPPPPMLVADPPPTADGNAPGAGVIDFDRGVAYIKLGAYEKALPHLDTAIAAMPSNAQAHYYQALVFEQTGARDRAEAGYLKAIELDDKLVDARVNLGALYLDEPAQPDKAIAALAPAAELDPDAADVRENLAFAYRLVKKYDDSEKHYSAALDKAPEADKARLHYVFADMLFEAKKLPAMVVQLKLAQPAFEKVLKTMVVFAHRYAKGKAFNECLAAFNIVIAIKADEPGFYVHRGLCQHSLKEVTAARADYKSALDLDQRYQAAWYYTGMSWLGDERRTNAAAAFEKAIKIDKTSKVGKKAKAQIDNMVAEGRR